MHRFYLPREQCNGPALTLTGRESHHGQRVLRLRSGEQVTVLDGVGTKYLCRVTALSHDNIQLAVEEKKQSSAPACAITLVQSIPKGKLLDAIIQKATELGVSRIIPLLSERVVSQIDEEKSESKTEHWQTTAIEAVKQCGSPWLPKVEAPISPAQFLARNESFDLFLIASLQASSRHARTYFDAFRKSRGLEPASVCVWVGPEGDFTAGEVAMVMEAGALPITLGRLVLRCETAATYCLSVINYELSSASA